MSIHKASGYARRRLELNQVPTKDHKTDNYRFLCFLTDSGKSRFVGSLLTFHARCILKSSHMGSLFAVGPCGEPKGNQHLWGSPFFLRQTSMLFAHVPTTVAETGFCWQFR